MFSSFTVRLHKAFDVELDEKQLGSDLVPLFTYSTPTQKKIGKNDINYDQNTEVTIHL